MRMLTTAAAIAALAAGAPALAETHTVDPGEGAQERLQEALILAQPGDEIVLGAGRFEMTDGLSLDVDRVTVRGAGSGETVLDFTSQADAGEGLLVTSDFVTLRDFAIENPHGDGIKSKGADSIVYHAIRVTWTDGPKPTNGAYGIYPVESTGILITGCEVSGASDAGIYVGQSRDITVRESLVHNNVAGIEIENSRNAVVQENLATRNTGGILVFDLPGLPVMGGGDVVVRENLVALNDTDNFAPPGNIVGGVKRGTGILVMANENVLVEENLLSNNDTAQVMVVSYTLSFDDERYNPYPRNVVIGDNMYVGGGAAPDLDGAEQLLAAFGGQLPPVLWDGLSDGDRVALSAVEGTSGWSLNLTQQGTGLEQANPGPLMVPEPDEKTKPTATGAPEELLHRIEA